MAFRGVFLFLEATVQIGTKPRLSETFSVYSMLSCGIPKQKTPSSTGGGEVHRVSVAISLRIAPVPPPGGLCCVRVLDHARPIAPSIHVQYYGIQPQYRSAGSCVRTYIGGLHHASDHRCAGSCLRSEGVLDHASDHNKYTRTASAGPCVRSYHI